MDDLISRQAAIDIAPKLIVTLDGYEMHNQAIANYCVEITQLPPAQPERIIHCKDCEWWTKQECSPQGRCALSGMYPTGGWFCGNARRREVTI